MIMATVEFTQYLESLFPNIIFLTNETDRKLDKFVAVFSKGKNAPSVIALGGVENTSSNQLPLSLLVHWTESATYCEQTANALYDTLLASSDFLIGNRRIVLVDMLDSAPVGIDRDDKGIAEMVIRLNIIYEREVS